MAEGGSTTFVSESKVSGNQANIPAHVRRELDIEDGDRLRWRFSPDDELFVEVVHRRKRTFEGFEGYERGRVATWSATTTRSASRRPTTKPASEDGRRGARHDGALRDCGR